MEGSAEREGDIVRIRCAICDKPVDKWTVWNNALDHSRTIEVECHGDKDTMVIRDVDLLNLSLAQLTELENQEGVAFQDKRLETSK